jgi:TonB family protein
MALPQVPDATIARNDAKPSPIRDPGTGVLSEAIRHVDRYSNGEMLQNVQGNGDFGPSFQFDSKGVDFGSWLRRFRAQVYRNWLIPYAAMALHGHVVLTFNIHKDGTITDMQIVQPSSVDAFTKAAFGAIKSSNPTVPLPTEFPDPQMRMTVVFYYNEQPPGGGGQ